MSDERPLYGLVLAGGRSRRMGADKALLVKDGRTQLERMVSLLEQFAERVFVSARADQSAETERARYAQIVDRYEDLGPVAGILSAMDEYPGADWLVVACDLPNVDAATLGTLLSGRSESVPFTAFASSLNGLPEPLCAVYAKGAADYMRACIDTGLKCPRKMMLRADARLLTQPDPRALDNVNTPEDLETGGVRIHS